MAGSGVGTAEVLRGNRVEELPELLDLVLLLIRNDQAGLVQHGLVGVDGHAGAQRKSDGVTRTRGHPDVAVEHQLGEERPLLQVRDANLLKVTSQSADNVLEQ